MGEHLVDVDPVRHYCHASPPVVSWDLRVHYGDESVDDVLGPWDDADHCDLVGASGSSVGFAAAAAPLMGAPWTGYSSTVKAAIQAQYASFPTCE